MKFMLRDVNKEENYGLVIDTYAYCHDFKVTTGASGKKYAIATLSDASGQVNAKIWQESITGKEEKLVGEVVRVLLKIQLFDGAPSCVINLMAKAGDEYEPSEIARGLNLEQRVAYTDRLNKYIEAVKDDDIRRLLKAVFTDEMVRAFCDLPAGIKHHHNFNGALLVHTLEVCDIASSMYKVHSTYSRAKEYRKNINLDMLIAGALLHDIGKVKEYESFPSMTRLVEGKLLGHLTAGVMMLTGIASSLDISNELVMELVHIIMSSHGDYGETKPMTLEAIIIAHADDLSASVDGYCVFCEEDDKKHPNDTDRFGYSTLKGQYFLKR